MAREFHLRKSFLLVWELLLGVLWLLGPFCSSQWHWNKNTPLRDTAILTPLTPGWTSTPDVRPHLINTSQVWQKPTLWTTDCKMNRWRVTAYLKTFWVRGFFPLLNKIVWGKASKTPKVASRSEELHLLIRSQAKKFDFLKSELLLKLNINV